MCFDDFFLFVLIFPSFFTRIPNLLPSRMKLSVENSPLIRRRRMKKKKKEDDKDAP